MGWVVEVQFPMEQQQLPAWHGPGLVVETARHESLDGEMEDWAHVFFEGDGWDDWCSNPAGDPEVSFYKPVSNAACRRKRCSCKGEGPCVSRGRMKAARAVLAVGK